MSALQRLVTRTVTFFLCASVAAGAFAVVQHPMDPLEDTEILGAAFVLLGAGAAQPGAIFQSIDLREPSEGCRARLPAGQSDLARRHGLLPPGQEELQDASSISTTARSRRPC